MADLALLETALGHRFEDRELLQLALSHRSVGARNNERLEFLGDSILNHIIAEALYQRFPSAREGEMSRMRASLVKGDTLAELARELELGIHLRLGGAERGSGARHRTSILADALEAVTGAILLESGVENCRRCVLAWFDERLQELVQSGPVKDPKTSLQEYLQGRGLALPEYRLLSVSGEDHALEHRVACRLAQPDLETEGVGSSRRRAEQAAARAALEQLQL